MKTRIDQKAEVPYQEQEDNFVAIIYSFLSAWNGIALIIFFAGIFI